jgi:hypothetical protein
MPINTQKFVAIDREVLLGRSIGLAPHLKALDFLAKLKFLPLVTPTTMAVIKDAEIHGNTTEKRRFQIVVQDVLDSDIVRPSINDTYQQVMDIHADKLLSKNVIKGGDKVDALILAEAAYLEAKVLLTTNPALRDAHEDSLKLALLECGMESVFIVSPKEIVDYMESSEEKSAEKTSAS